jgi:hypothetical protein
MQFLEKQIAGNIFFQKVIKKRMPFKINGNQKHTNFQCVFLTKNPKKNFED